MSGKNKLVPQSEGQKNAYSVKPESFPGQSGKKGEMAGAKNVLVKGADSPRLAEGEGGAADSMSAKTAAVGRTFSVGRNGGEANSAPTNPGAPESVDLATGQISVSGYKKTRKGETAGKNVTIG